MERAQLESIVQATGAVERHGGYRFLCDPHWTRAQRAQFERIIQSESEAHESKIAAGWLGVATGGSSGGLRLARHDEHTIGAAVRGFCAHFGVSRVNAVGVLPPHHVSGLMAAARCAATGGRLVAWTWKQLEAGERPVLAVGDWFLSLVPTQLQRVLEVPATVAWLRDFHTIFIGGGPVWPELMERAAQARVPVAFSYGMTETAAMIAAQTAAEFAAGDRSSGRVMPHAQVVIDVATGRIRVAGESVFRGYFGGEPAGRSFLTDDLGAWDAQGRLHILGRHDGVIITGGKKVHPAEVEAALRATGQFDDVAVIGLPDKEWGERVVACHPAGKAVDPERIPLDALAVYQRPKQFIAVRDWPRNAQGKIDRAALRAAASALPHPDR